MEDAINRDKFTNRKRQREKESEIISYKIKGRTYKKLVTYFYGLRGEDCSISSGNIHCDGKNIVNFDAKTNSKLLSYCSQIAAAFSKEPYLSYKDIILSRVNYRAQKVQ
jgi:hypothetical protein